MLSPSQQHMVMQSLGSAYPIRERRACLTIPCAMATYRHQSHRDPRTSRRQRMTELAWARVRYGYRKIWVLLHREGWAVGKYLVYRLYWEEGLPLRHRLPRRRKAVVARAHQPPVMRPNDAWTLDFVAEQLVNGHRFRVLTVVDVYTRDRLAIEVEQCFRSEHVVHVLTRLTAQRGAPTPAAL